MKKVLLTGAALMAFAAASFAQTNTGTVQQAGTNQSALQLQTGNYLQSSISQLNGTGTNVGNFGATRQESVGAAGNKAFVNQNDGAKSNRGYVTQLKGTGNVGSITQENNSGAGSLQVTVGTSSADVRAAGGNWGGIFQQGSNNANTFIIQGNTATKNFADIAQYGTNNRQTSIDQSNNSTNNEATIKQGTADAGVSNNQASVSQQGNSNDNQAFITQLSNNNNATITQNDYSYDNKATVKQSIGTGNTGTIQQRNNSDGQASVLQTGYDNTGTINQINGSYYEKATVEQMGSSGKATINQIYDGYGVATIKQNGYNNEAVIDQINGGTVAGTGNTATITQDLATTAGSNNKARIIQGEVDGSNYSKNNVATIKQEYSYNTANLMQVGNGNTGALSQTGDYNVIKGVSGDFALQRGNNNILTVTQDSGGSAPYVPNVASVSQMGTGNSAVITQVGRNALP